MATPQGCEEEDPHDIEMKDVEDDPNPPPLLEQDDDPLPVPVQAVQSDPLPEDDESQGDTKYNRDIIIKDKRIVIKAGGATPITLAEVQLLDD